MIYEAREHCRWKLKILDFRLTKKTKKNKKKVQTIIPKLACLKTFFGKQLFGVFVVIQAPSNLLIQVFHFFVFLVLPSGSATFDRKDTKKLKKIPKSAHFGQKSAEMLAQRGFQKSENLNFDPSWQEIWSHPIFRSPEYWTTQVPSILSPGRGVLFSCHMFVLQLRTDFSSGFCVFSSLGHHRG